MCPLYYLELGVVTGYITLYKSSKLKKILKLVRKTQAGSCSETVNMTARLHIVKNALQ